MFTQPDGNELTTIIVKIIIIMVVILIIGALLRSCFFSILDYTELGGGSGDWIYTLLPGNYAIIRANTDTIQLVVYQKEKNGIQSVVVDSYISAFWKDDRYIIIKQYPNKKKKSYERFFYCVDTSNNEITGPLDDDGFSLLCIEKEIEINKWILTVPAPVGSVF